MDERILDAQHCGSMLDDPLFISDAPINGNHEERSHSNHAPSLLPPQGRTVFSGKERANLIPVPEI